MNTLVRIAFMLLCCATLFGPASVSAATVKKVTIPASAFSPLMTQQVDSRLGIFNGSVGPGEVFFWATLDLPVGVTIKGMSYRHLSPFSLPTVVGLDRVQPGKAPAWQRVLEATSSEVMPPGTSGIIVVATPTGVTRKVAKGWKYFVLVKALPFTFVGEVKVKYIIP